MFVLGVWTALRAHSACLCFRTWLGKDVRSSVPSISPALHCSRSSITFMSSHRVDVYIRVLSNSSSPTWRSWKSHAPCTITPQTMVSTINIYGALHYCLVDCRLLCSLGYYTVGHTHNNHKEIMGKYSKLRLQST